MHDEMNAKNRSRDTVRMVISKKKKIQSRDSKAGKGYQGTLRSFVFTS